MALYLNLITFFFLIFTSSFARFFFYQIISPAPTTRFSVHGNIMNLERRPDYLPGSRKMQSGDVRGDPVGTVHKL
jgi:hypothetical protein